MILYDKIVLVDDKGDSLYKIPHLYVENFGTQSPFEYNLETLSIGEKKFQLTKKYKKISEFPKAPRTDCIGKIHKSKKIELNDECLEIYKNSRLDAPYIPNNKYDFLKKRDVIIINQDPKNAEGEYIQITHVYNEKISKILEKIKYSFDDKKTFDAQMGDKYKKTDTIKVIEFKRICKWKLDKLK